jgi:hypothetical protein
LTNHTVPTDQYEVVWPLGKRAYADSDIVDRVADLSGKRIAAIWDYLFRGDEIFEIVSRKLSEQFPGMTFVAHQVFGNTHGSEQRKLVALLPEKLREHRVDAVISSVGA